MTDTKEYQVNIWETYSEKRENATMAVGIKVEAREPSDAIRQARRMAVDWNRGREAIRANVITCHGHISYIG